MLDLRPIKDRLAAATPGPWNDAKSQLILNAPADLAALVAEVERLRAAIEEHKRTVKPGDDYCGADVILWRAIDA